MDILKKVFNRKFLYSYIFLLLLLVFLYFNKKYQKDEIFYGMIYILIGFMISLFYVLKDFIYTPDKLQYKQVIMEDALFNHKGEIIEEFEAYPLYEEFISFHLTRKDEDPYNDTVTSLQAVRYKKSKMIDSLYIPLKPEDPLLSKYVVPLNDAIGRFLRYADGLPIIIYNQPFTHTFLNIKLDKEVHISFIDAMKMSKDLYGIANKPISQLQKYLGFYNLEGDQVKDAKVIGAIYLDYIYTVSKYRAKAEKKASLKSFQSKSKKTLNVTGTLDKNTSQQESLFNKEVLKTKDPKKADAPEEKVHENTNLQ
jgi:hypothetical protein